MAFSLAGNTITQSGTDTAASVISGIGAIAGVTSTSFSTYTRLYIPYKLNITGTMTTDQTVAFSMTRGGTFANEITIGGGASWTAKVVRNLNGYSYYYQLPSLDFNNAALSGSTFNGNNLNAIIVNGGTLDLANIVINGDGGQWWNGGTIRFRDVTFNAQGLSSVADTQFTTQSGNPTIDIIGWKVIGGKIFLGGANITNFKGVQPIYMQRGFGTFVATGFVLEDFIGGGGNYGDLSSYGSPNYEARNLGIGTSTSIISWLGNGPALGTIRATSDILLSVKNNTGASVSDFISYLKDNAAGAPTGFTSNIYYINTAASGALSQRILIGVAYTAGGFTTTSFVKRSATQLDDLYAFNIFDYNHNILTTQSFDLKGTGVKSAAAIAVVDSNVTLTKANALAKLASSFTVNTSTNTITVTANSTLDNLYDAMKAFKCQAIQANLEYPTLTTLPVSASGSGLVTAMNIVINAGVTLSDGSKFTSLTTSGTVTSAGVISTDLIANVTTTGTLASGAAITGNVSQATPTSLTGVTINGNLTYNTNSPITITLTNCVISGTVSNSGSGAVTISLSNTTIGTVGANVSTRPVTALTLNGLTAGSQIYIMDNTGAQFAYIASSGTSYTLDTTGYTGTWTCKVARYGYSSQGGTFSPAIASLTATITLAADVFVTEADPAVVEAYTTLETLDKLYDYAAYYETTNGGIVYSRVITKAGTAASAGSYPVTLNSTGDVWAFSGSALEINSTTTLAAGTTITGSLFTSSTVTLTDAQTDTSITANVLQTTPTDLDGMVITGNLNYDIDTDVTVTFTDCTVTGTITNDNTGEVKVLKAGTSNWFTAGDNVLVRANIAITTADDLALTTAVLQNGYLDLGWVPQDPARVLEVAQGDTFTIYAIAYGYQAALFSATADDFATFRIALNPDVFIDTTLDPTVRDTIVASFYSYRDDNDRFPLTINTDLRSYLPSEVLNALQYYVVTQGYWFGTAVIFGAPINGFTFIQGGVYIADSNYYFKVDDTITTPTNIGFLLPLVIGVDPAVYTAYPAYSPVEMNTSDIVMQYAPWTLLTADISASDRADIAAKAAVDVWDTFLQASP